MASKTYDDHSPFLQRLLNLLEKPRSLDIAEKMLESWANNKPIISSTQSDVTHLCLCSMLKDYHNKATCQSFHWSCMFNCLTTQSTQIYNNDIISCTHFSKLSVHVQIQFLTLLVQLHKSESIPTHLLRSFVERVKNDSRESTWTHYLLRKLTVSCDQSQTVMMMTPISSQTIGTITNLHITHIGQPLLDTSVIPVTLTDTVARRSRKRKNKSFKETQTKFTKLSSESLSKQEAIVTSDKIDNSCVTTVAVKLPDNVQLLVESIMSTWSRGQKAPSDHFLSLVNLPSKEFQNCLLQLGGTSESNVVGVILNMTDEIDISYQHQISCLRHLITPHFMVLQKPVPRSLLASLMTVIIKYSLASVDGLLYPLLLISQFNGSQSDLICKLIKEVLTDEQRNTLWRKLSSTSDNINGGPFIWNEYLIKVFQTLIEKGVLVVCAHNFTKLLQANAGYHTNSLRFACLIMALLTKHHTELSKHCSLITDIIEGSKTSLKNKLISLARTLNT